MSSALRASE